VFVYLGYYCETRGLSNATASCKEGWYCPTGSKIPTPKECPIGFHCPKGSNIPKPCSPGYYTNSSGSPACEKCPAGFYCVPLDLNRNESKGYFKCPRGYYCPIGTGLNWRPCPAGTYSNSYGLDNDKQCIDCDPGKFCLGTNLTSYSGSCDAGYYCTSGDHFVEQYNIRLFCNLVFKKFTAFQTLLINN